MPLFGFFCDDDHETERFCSRSARPPEIECGTCGGAARYRLSVSMSQSLTVAAHGETERIEDAKQRQDDKGYVWRDICCEHCGYEDIEDIDLVDGSVPVEVACPGCSANAAVQPVSINIDRFSERFPYYDKGLGLWLKSKAHRREVCKLRGLTPVDGDWDVEREFSQWDTQVEREKQEYAAYCDRLDNHPAFKGFRKKQALGIV